MGSAPPDVDPVAWLRATPPFDELPQPLFEAAVGELEIGWWGAGARLATVGGTPLSHLHVIRAGAVRLERDGQTLQLLEEGETFGYASLLTGKASFDVIVEAPLLAYLLPRTGFERLLGDAHFAGHFAASLSDRLRSSLAHARVAPQQADLSQPVAGLVRRPPVWIDADATAGDAARRMRTERISSLLVRGEPPGIVTARDFRSRVLAEGLGPETPLARIFSRPLHTVEAGAPLHEAWTTLLETGVHHLPVTRAGEIVGMVTSTDLLRCGGQGPLALLRRVEGLASREALPGHAAGMAELVGTLHGGGLEAPEIAALVARLDDALLRRIAGWAEAELGPAPAPWAWLALGSEGRRERTLPTDQDHALVYADAGAGARGWYERLAERVTADLEAAGYPRCPGGCMATRWHGTLTEWRGRFDGWVDAPSPRAILESGIFFDFRPVAGALPLAPLDEVVAGAAAKPVFLRFLAKAALEFHPPPALVLTLRGGARLDLKSQGIAPVVGLARCQGLEAGGRGRGTLERLEAAARAGVVDEGIFAAVDGAYRFLAGLRLRLQLRDLAEGRPASNEVALSALSAVERSRLKEAFRAVRRWQERAVYHYRADV